MSDFSEQPKTPTKQIGQNYVGGMATSQGRTQSGGGAFSTSAQTPFRNQTKDLLPPDERKLERRRDWLYGSLGSLGGSKTFSELLDDLGLTSEFSQFETDHPKLFESLAERAPAFVDMNMVGTRKIGSRVPLLPDELSVPDILKVDKEKAVTTYFQKLVDLMSVEAAEQNAHYAQSEQNDKSVPSAEYNLVDHQTSEVAGGRKHKMDLVFYNPVASDGVANVHIIVEAKKAEFKNKIDVKTFSQIADYQYSVWKVQPTRTFVPVLLPNGPKLDLVVFARESWYRVEVGYLCHWLATINNHNIEKVRSTMAQLYFLITLPSERFGHFCKASLGWEYVTFVRGPNRDSTIALVESSHSPTTNSVKLSGYIERFVHPRGRLAHVFRTTFRKQKAILKLSWTPVGRMPEGAVYELLENANVKGMPRVFGRGLVCTSLFGYRLEYLVLEDCGSTIHEYLQVGRQGGLSSGSLNNRVTGIVWQTLQCLVQARVKANVLHRDISAGNIMIDSDGVVRIIDWGYAKVIDDASFDINERATRDRRALLDATANRWRYVSAKVQQNEDAHDPLTGTPLYMSIPVLAGAKERGLADDVESLFYVILHVLTKLQATPDSAACAFDQYDNKYLAMIRTGCLSNAENFLRFFGISSCSDDLRRLLCDLRKFLFVNSDGFIASNLIIDPSTPRGAVDLLQPYVDADTMGLLLRKDEAALTPMKSAVQLPSFRPPSSSSSGPLDEARYSENAGVSIGGLGMSSRSLGKRAREAEGTEESDGGSLGSVSKRSKSQG